MFGSNSLPTCHTVVLQPQIGWWAAILVPGQKAATSCWEEGKTWFQSIRLSFNRQIFRAATSKGFWNKWPRIITSTIYASPVSTSLTYWCYWCFGCNKGTATLASTDFKDLPELFSVQQQWCPFMGSKDDDITGVCLCPTASAPSSVLVCVFLSPCTFLHKDVLQILRLFQTINNNLFKSTSKSNRDPWPDSWTCYS